MDEDTRLFRIWLVGWLAILCLLAGTLTGIIFLIRKLFSSRTCNKPLDEWTEGGRLF